MPLTWRYEAKPGGVEFRLVRKGLIGAGKPVPVAEWPDARKQPGIGLLRHWIDREIAAVEGESTVRVPHAAVARLHEPQARDLNLPPTIPFVLSLNSHGRLDEADFDISLRWLRYGTTRVTVKRTGALALSGEHWYRLPQPLFEVAEAVDAFRAADTRDADARLAAWAPVQEALQRATGQSVRPDGYLADLQILHAGAFSLSIDMRADDISFDPVLFGRHQRTRTALDPEGSDADPDDPGGQGVDELIDEAEALLPKEVQQLFVEKRVGPDRECRWAYPLKRNQFVVFDEPLRQALNVVKRKQRAPLAEKRAFLQNPRAEIAAALDLDPDSPAAVGLFLETQQYADRIRDIGIWQPKVLPWLPKAQSSWLPEKLGLQVAGRVVELAPEQVGELKQRYAEADAAGQESFSFAEAEAIPVTPDTGQAIQQLDDVARRMLAAEQAAEPEADEAAADDDEGEQTPASDKRYVLEIEDNIEELGYETPLRPRTPHAPLAPPSRLIDPSKLLAHQREGFDWMVANWRIGRPGALLADDMGLGKTLQALAFAAWLDEHYAHAPGGPRGPFLVVAPTALLKNWGAEHDTHLTNGGLGQVLELYGGGVKKLRTEPQSGRDIELGRRGLDLDQMRQASWILTTYETLANYHFSFAAIPYPFVIFDEIQKIKTPTTINTHAAKTLNADFVLGLTGTPVENRLSDLWSIMDRLHPGLLGDLHSFSQTYDAEDRNALQALHDTMTDASAGAPVMLRRMKGAVELPGALPERRTEELPADMPPPQAEAYETLVQDARGGGGKKRILEILHAIRGVSLHPRPPSEVLGRTADYDGYVKDSARIRQCLAALDAIHRRGEKALVFIEAREMQDVFADILRVRYDLARTPRIINGGTPSARRQAYVDEFQAQPPGFDVMLLSPRAAGVGLTLTAANHVIHLSRWWNPAVEDQCNDRVYRIGQEKPVTVYCPMARHPVFGEQSFDLKLNTLLARKRSLSRELLVPAESDSDYREMFTATTAGDAGES